ncbi:MAG TPA: alpha/beta hydrolase-fold protein [Vicinamibacterales bacterium]|nr:alpha/beta hydrolase-fold protein [Vicinamibacterales bacterium]
MDVRTIRDLWSPELRNHRTVDVYLPASYEGSRRRYPVVYMQDGQNLSDPAAAFAGTWHLAEALRALADDGIEAIVVGIHNMGPARLAEYSPFPDPRHGGGRGQAYLRFVARTLKPRIDRSFRTRRRRESTFIAGSSMGGLIALYALYSAPGIFGGAAAMSPSLWFGRGRMLTLAARSRPPRGRLYLDVGTAEGYATLHDTRRFRDRLLDRGFDSRRLKYVESEGATHDEAAWGARLPDALRFLLD